MHRFRSPLVLVGWLAVLSSAPASQSPDVRGASIALVPRGVDIQVITIENCHTHALVAWALRWTSPEGGTRRSVAEYSADPLPPRRGAGPLQPGERRTIEQPSSKGIAIGAPTLALAVFSDGSMCGADEGPARDWPPARTAAAGRDDRAGGAIARAAPAHGAPHDQRRGGAASAAGPSPAVNR
jgi:hypothetical protein